MKNYTKTTAIWAVGDYRSWRHQNVLKKSAIYYDSLDWLRALVPQGGELRNYESQMLGKNQVVRCIFPCSCAAT